MKAITKFNLLILFIICLEVNSDCQTIKGEVQDNQTSELLSYVHIGVIGKNMGTISKEDGTFEMSIEKGKSTDTLGFSMIGYETKKMSLNELNQEYLIIKLKPTKYNLSLITIEESRLVRKSLRKKKIGAKRFISTMTGGGGTGWGGEIGIKIRNGGNLYKVNRLNFRLNEITHDSILFRVNFYKVDGDMPSESILTKEIFLKGYYGEEWVSGFLEDENIFFDEDIIVSIETIKVWNSRKKGYTMFFKKRILYSSKVYLKDTSMSDWYIGDVPKLALNLDVQKYKRKTNK